MIRLPGLGERTLGRVLINFLDDIHFQGILDIVSAAADRWSRHDDQLSLARLVSCRPDDD